MSMLKIFIARVSAILACVFDFLFFSVNFEMSNLWSVLALVGCFVTFASITYGFLKGRSEEEVKEILGLAWIENKTGINFTEE